VTDPNRFQWRAFKAAAERLRSEARGGLGGEPPTYPIRAGQRPLFHRGDSRVISRESGFPAPGVETPD